MPATPLKATRSERRSRAAAAPHPFETLAASMLPPLRGLARPEAPPANRLERRSGREASRPPACLWAPRDRAVGEKRCRGVVQRRRGNRWRFPCEHEFPTEHDPRRLETTEEPRLPKRVARGVLAREGGGSRATRVLGLLVASNSGLKRSLPRHRGRVSVSTRLRNCAAAQKAVTNLLCDPSPPDVHDSGTTRLCPGIRACRPCVSRRLSTAAVAGGGKRGAYRGRAPARPPDRRRKRVL